MDWETLNWFPWYRLIGKKEKGGDGTIWQVRRCTPRNKMTDYLSAIEEKWLWRKEMRPARGEQWSWQGQMTAAHRQLVTSGRSDPARREYGEDSECKRERGTLVPRRPFVFGCTAVGKEEKYGRGVSLWSVWEKENVAVYRMCRWASAWESAKKTLPRAYKYWAGSPEQMSGARCGTPISIPSKMHLKQINHIRKLRKESLQREAGSAKKEANGQITQRNHRQMTVFTFLRLLTVGAPSLAET